jgi:hypothetical protein
MLILLSPTRTSRFPNCRCAVWPADAMAQIETTSRGLPPGTIDVSGQPEPV